MRYTVYDPHAEVDITQGRLPHWEQAGSYHFITFRTADSLPRSVNAACRDERDRWLMSRGIDPTKTGWRDRLDALPPAARRAFAIRFASAVQRRLDQGHGRCMLRRPDLRCIVEEALLHFDGDRYGIDAFVVMPNHVHVLVGLSERGSLVLQCRSWKRYTATRINALLGRRGEFWQTESWDRVIRSPESFVRTRRYIAANPRRAGLKPEEYTLFLKHADEALA